MNQRLVTSFLLGLNLLAGGKASCQALENPPTKLEPQTETYDCEPEAQECKNQIMKREELSEALCRSRSFGERIEIQKIKRVGKNSYMPDAINFYEGEATFGKKPRFRKNVQLTHWSSLFWRFNLPGFVEMFFLDPEYFNGLNYDLQYEGEEMLLRRRCWVYSVTPRKHAKGRHFTGRIWVLPQELVIIQAQGSFQPMRRVLWYFAVEDHWFAFDSRRKEISAGKWMPDYACAGVSPAASDFTEPAFNARITIFSTDGDKPSPASETACGVGMDQFPVRATIPERVP